MRNWFWLLSSALAWGASAAPPERVAIAYDIARNGTTVAEALHHIEHNGRVYQITESWKGRGIFAFLGTATRTSRGVVGPDGLKPLEFADERAGRSTARAKFDWTAKTVVMQYKGEPRTEPLPARAHDRLAFMFDFAFAPPRSGEVAFDLLDGRGLSRHVYTVNGHERLTTPFGDFDTVKLVRVTENERAEIWLATGRSYLPLRVLVIGKDGTRVDQVATKMSSQ